MENDFLEKQKMHFKKHIATFTDYGNIKILDFKAPDTSEYRIRFLFEEDYCRLHISGDLGELVATNYNNMTYEKFSDFVNNTGYFHSKVNCMNREVYVYDRRKAHEDLLNLLDEYDLKDKFKPAVWETQDEVIHDFIEDVLEDFTEERGIGSKGYDAASEYIMDFFEDAAYIGRENTGILELYMLAFKLATQQLEENKKKENEVR